MPRDGSDHEQFIRAMNRNGLGGASRLDLYNSDHLENGYGVDLDGGLGRVKKPVWLLGGVLLLLVVLVPITVVVIDELIL